MLNIGSITADSNGNVTYSDNANGATIIAGIIYNSLATPPQNPPLIPSAPPFVQPASIDPTTLITVNEDGSVDTSALTNHLSTAAAAPTLTLRPQPTPTGQSAVAKIHANVALANQLAPVFYNVLIKLVQINSLAVTGSVTILSNVYPITGTTTIQTSGGLS